MDPPVIIRRDGCSAVCPGIQPGAFWKGRTSRHPCLLKVMVRSPSQPASYIAASGSSSLMGCLKKEKKRKRGRNTSVNLDLLIKNGGLVT